MIRRIKKSELSDNVRRERDYVVAKLIKDRDFDIPVSVYDEITEGVVIRLINLYEIDHWLDSRAMLYNEYYQTFIKYVRNDMRLEKDRPLYTFLRDSTKKDIDGLRMLFFREGDWKKYCKERKDVPLSVKVDWLIDMLEVTLSNDDQASTEQVIPIYNTLLKYADVRVVLSILMHHTKGEEAVIVEPYHKNGKWCELETFPSPTYDDLYPDVTINEVVKLAYILRYNESFILSYYCTELEIPILYKNYSWSDVEIYLELVLKNGYRGKLDPRLDNINDRVTVYSSHEPIKTYLLEIGDTLNQSAYKYFAMVTGYKFKTPLLIDRLNCDVIDEHDYGWKMNPTGRLKDFRELIYMVGNNSAGISIELQTVFLNHGGDIRTMFDETGKLYPEASIIKMADQLQTLLGIILFNEDDMVFLLHNSPDFVKNIMDAGAKLTTKEYVKIADALFTDPIDEDLWALLNNGQTEDGVTSDYRVALINQIIYTISQDVLFGYCPKAMLYLEPSVLYISRNSSDETTRYAPVHLVSPYLKGFISRNQYQKLNRYCNGHYVSILSALGDDTNDITDVLSDLMIKSSGKTSGTIFLINEMISNGKFGYLCDMEEQDTHGLIHTMAIRLAIENISSKIQSERDADNVDNQ
jgi:hypothetical protein